MRSGVADSPSSVARRGSSSSRSRRPWLLIVAALLLAVLSTVLWAKWEESRVRAERLQAEIKQVYSEAEGLRTEAARLSQRVAQLERQLRETLATEPASRARPRARP